MKRYDQLTKSLLERRDQYVADRKKRKKQIIGIAAPLGCFLLVAALSFGVWQSGVFQPPASMVNDQSLVVMSTALPKEPLNQQGQNQQSVSSSVPGESSSLPQNSVPSENSQGDQNLQEAPQEGTKPPVTSPSGNQNNNTDSNSGNICDEDLSNQENEDSVAGIDPDTDSITNPQPDHLLSEGGNKGESFAPKPISPPNIDDEVAGDKLPEGEEDNMYPDETDPSESLGSDGGCTSSSPTARPDYSEFPSVSSLLKSG